jgi:hypothetical protein
VSSGRQRGGERVALLAKFGEGGGIENLAPMNYWCEQILKTSRHCRAIQGFVFRYKK